MKKLLTAIGIVAATSAAFTAQAYQFEVGARYSHVDVDHAGSDNAFGLYGQYFFQDVRVGTLPYAEAAFLNRSSFAYVTTSDDFDHVSAGAAFYIPDTMFYVAGEVRRDKFPGAGHNNDWGIKLGLTPIAGLLVWTQYYDEPGYDANIHAKYVVDLDRNNTINIEAGYTDDDYYNDSYIIADYYFNRGFSVGVGYNETFDNDAFLVRTNYYLTPEIAITGQFTKGDYFDALTVGASFRF